MIHIKLFSFPAWSASQLALISEPMEKSAWRAFANRAGDGREIGAKGVIAILRTPGAAKLEASHQAMLALLTGGLNLKRTTSPDLLSALNAGLQSEESTCGDEMRRVFLT